MPLLEICQHHNVTVHQVAERLGVHPDDVQRWEKSGWLPLYALNPIAQMLRCQPARLLGIMKPWRLPEYEPGIYPPGRYPNSFFPWSSPAEEERAKNMSAEEIREAYSQYFGWPPVPADDFVF